MKDFSSLVTEGVTREPINIIIHAKQKTGKTSLADSAESVLFVTAEESENVKSKKLPKCKSWDDFIEQLTFLRDSDYIEKNGIKNIAIDTIDTFESLLHDKILKSCPEYPKYSESMAKCHGGYSNSYGMATRVFTDLVNNYLARIREEKYKILFSLSW
mgnify:FL=1